ncbi:MAG TPA: V-type ATPase 116kDa subunit family protein, partial [Nitrososphaerales archaeon]|nr:V-type ATPase 116kDa subunit family protein [Nitrososphaerales archaeon]
SVESDIYDKRLSKLASNAYRISSELSFVVDNLAMNVEPPILKKAFGGIRYDKTSIEASDWEEYVKTIDERSIPIISGLGELIRQRRSLEKSRDDNSSLQATLRALSSFSIDLSLVTSMKRFHVELVILDSEDASELKKSLPESLLLVAPISEKESLALVIGSVDQSDRITKSLRSFDVRPITIPKDLPQRPDLAFQEIGARKIQIDEEIKKTALKTMEAVKGINDNILGLREAADVAYSVLEELKKSGKLDRFSIIQGYVPTKLVPELEKGLANRWPIIKYLVDPAQSYATGLKEEETGGEVEDQPPTLFNSKNSVVKAHETVTLTSGPPVYGELDPTPILTFTFPVFYGMMFGDVGHGLLMTLVGALIYLRGTYDLKKWGILLLFAGISATIWGSISGELFGFELPRVLQLAPFLNLEPLKQELNFNSNTVFFFIKLAIYIGIIDLYIGMFIGLINKLRARDYGHMIASTLPTIVGYTFFVVLALTFRSLRYDVNALLSFTNVTANIGLIGFFASVIWLFVAGPVLVKMGKIHGSIGGELGNAAMEFLEWVVSKFLANTVSYVRLAILLIVHAALLAATDELWFAYQGTLVVYIVVPVLVILNLLIFAFEGLIVYVQALRLHLYEFFSKFYVGTGSEFRKIIPERLHVVIKWKQAVKT